MASSVDADLALVCLAAACSSKEERAAAMQLDCLQAANQKDSIQEAEEPAADQEDGNSDSKVHLAEAVAAATRHSSERAAPRELSG